MAVEIAIDYNTGDLKIAPNKGIDIRTGRATVDQRIRVRLKIVGGEWALDPTEGRLGSRLRDALRLPNWRASEEVPLMVREALEPMDDIDVRDVVCAINAETAKAIDITVYYTMSDDTAGEDILTTTLTIEG